MATMDGICIPIALFILWFMLRTWRLMLLPLATVVVSALVAFAIVYAISLKARVFTVVVRASAAIVEVGRAAACSIAHVFTTTRPFVALTACSQV